MRAFLSLLICLTVSNLYSQGTPPPLRWQHCYGGSLDDIGYGISPTGDGGFIFCGCAGSNDGNILKSSDPLHGGTCDYWGAKIDADSNIQFKFHYGGTGNEGARTIFQTSDGNYIMGGSAGSNDVDVVGHIGPYGDPDFWVLKINSSAQILWQKCYGGIKYDDFGSMIQTPDGGYAICGGTSSNDHDVSGNHGSSDYWLLKLDADGNIQWQKCYGDTDGVIAGSDTSGYEKAFDLKLCNDGGYILVGFTSSQKGQVTGNHSFDFDGWAVKTDAGGNIQWAKCFGGTGQDGFYKVKQLANGNFLIAGYAFSSDGDITTNHGGEDAWLVMLDVNGNLLWSKTYGGGSAEEFSSIQQDVLGGIHLSGYSKSSDGDLNQNYGGWDYWLASIDESGILLWDSTYGGRYDDVCNDFAISTEGRVAMIGYTKSDSVDVSGNHGMDTSFHPMYQSKADYWVVNLGSVVGIHEIPKTTLKVIPTLAHDVVQISAAGLAEENSLIMVRNASGQTVLSEMLNHESKIQLDISSLPQGIYFIEAKNEKLVAISKFVKM